MRKVLIANRGEIALKAVRAARRCGLQVVAVYSSADASSAHIFAADEAICIGGASPRESYLRGDVLIETALATGCDAVYPGYGFLAENAEFAEACARKGLTFVGPDPESIRTMGDKSMARATAARLDVPVVPGSPCAFTEVSEAAEHVDAVGFPMLVKASAGGGGRGMRVIPRKESFHRLFEQASREAEAAFGDGALYLERFFERVRHIEVQVFGDHHGNVRHLWDRDCSVQRRHQKLIEEAPATLLPANTRKDMADAALRLVRGTKYHNAGTIEFIYDMDSGEFFFIEMNTRIQVEHPVTERLTGTDLIAEQFWIAAGNKMRLPELETLPDGCFIEWRICAEDPSQNFTPVPGRITRLELPTGPNVAFESHVFPGYEISPFYDSMIGKLIVGGRNRDEALENSRHALQALRIEGVATTIPFHLAMLDEPDFIENDIHTRWIEAKQSEATSGSAHA